MAESKFKDAGAKGRFQDLVLGNMASNNYQDEDGKAIDGQAVSYLKTCLHMNGWKNLGNLGQFEDLCAEAGFKVVAGKNNRGQRARIVTL